MLPADGVGFSTAAKKRIELVYWPPAIPICSERQFVQSCQENWP
jgi:hypothetical protein